MTIHFAAARPACSPFVGRGEQHASLRHPANDNGIGLGHDVSLRDTLKHFARFGLGAAEAARREAERAFFAGDRQTYEHWLGICRALDRRLAASLHQRVEAATD